MSENDFNQYFNAKLDRLIPVQKQYTVFSGSIYEGITKLHPHGRGKVGEDIVDLLAFEFGFDCVTNNQEDRNGDRWINGYNVEVKLACQCESGGFIVNQLRPKHYYEYVIIIALQPNEAHIFTVPKAVIMDNHKTRGQHSGSDAVETAQYSSKNFQQLYAHFEDYYGIEQFKKAFQQAK